MTCCSLRGWCPLNEQQDLHIIKSHYSSYSLVKKNETLGRLCHYFLNLYSYQCVLMLNLLFRLNRSPQSSMARLIAFHTLMPGGASSGQLSVTPLIISKEAQRWKFFSSDSGHEVVITQEKVKLKSRWEKFDTKETSQTSQSSLKLQAFSGRIAAVASLSAAFQRQDWDETERQREFSSSDWRS